MTKIQNRIKVLFLISLAIISTSLVAQTTFTESAAAYGLNIGNNKDGGHAWADYDLDGDYDLVVNTNGRGYLLRNDGASGFTDVTNINGSLAPDFLNGTLERTALFVDFNNDGYPDVFRNDSSQARIYLQDPTTNKFGNGTGGTAPNQIFNSSNIADGFNSEGAGALDYDGDGDLDIFIDNHNFGIDILQNDGNGFFTQVTRKADSPNPPYNAADPTTWPLGLAQDATDGDYGSATDFNNDGWVDIVVRKRNQVDLFTNLGGTFGNEIEIDDANNSNKGAVAFQDFDNDGDFDLYWTEAGVNQIHRNNGDGTWTPLGASTGIPVNFSGQIEGIACGDVDNDGDIDIYLAGNNTNKLYLNQINNGGGTMSFIDSGLSFNNNNGEGATFIDIDTDGDLDLYTNRTGSNRLFINNLGAAAQANHLYIDIIEDRDAFGLINTEQRFGIGATATILDCSGNVISGIREVNGGYGHGTQEPGVIHFGLPGGPNTPIVLEVAYPRTSSGRVVVRQELTPIDFNNGNINIINVLPTSGNQPPIAQDDNVLTTQGSFINFDARVDNGNGIDTDPEATVLNVVSITQPPVGEGTAVLEVDGTITYTPGTFVGTTSFTYTIQDTNNICPFVQQTDVGTITVTVGPCVREAGIIVNEMSNGSGGSEDWVELLVIGNSANPTAPVDLTGWFFDDNNGDFEGSMSGVGIAQGSIVFGAAFNSVLPGSLIVIYNQSAKDPNIGADDPTDSDGDQVYILPGNHISLSGCSNLPSTSNSSYLPCTSVTASWSRVAMRNGGDAPQIRKPDGTFYHGYSYGDVTAPYPTFPCGGSSFNLGAGGVGSTFAFQCGDWEDATNFIRSDSGGRTPGAINSNDNLIFITNIINGTFDYSDLTSISNCSYADLSLTKTVNNAQPNQGDSITFTLTISNAGPSSPTNLIVKDIIPTEFTYTHPNFSTTQGTVSWNAGTREFEWNLGAFVLGAGNTISLSYTLTVDICGEFTNQAEITNSSLLDLDSTPNNSK